MNSSVGRLTFNFIQPAESPSANKTQFSVHSSSDRLHTVCNQTSLLISRVCKIFCEYCFKFSLQMIFWSEICLSVCSYCVQMRVKQASAACKVKPWSAGLVRERSVCVECQSDAMTTDNRCRGDGLQNIRYVSRTCIRKTYKIFLTMKFFINNLLQLG